MKILHVAVFTPTSTNVWQADAFEVFGHKVIRYDYRQRACVLDGGVGTTNPQRDKELIELCKIEKPDLILFSKCDKMDAVVVKECRKIGKTALWYMDPAGNINSELVLKIQNSDFVFSWRWDGVKEGLKYCKNTYRIYEGYDSKINYKMDVPKIRDVCFIGHMRGIRNTYREAVKFEILTGVYGKDHTRAVSETKINLNFTEGDGASDRVLKVLATGGFLLTNPWEKMENDFEVGKDLQIFTNVNELEQLIKYYVKNDDERETIALHGMETVKQYDDINYARSILEVVEDDESKLSVL